MPRTVSFPPPSATRCPICAAPLDRPECPGCGVSFTSADGTTLWQVDHDLFDLCRIRNDVVRRLLVTAEAERAVVLPEATGGADAASPAPPAPAVPSGPPGTGARPSVQPRPPARRPRRSRRSRRSPSVAEVLVGLGALSLVAAVVVFAAVSWSDLAAWAQGGLIVGATAVVGVLMAVCRRRELVATAESLGAVVVALALADVHVVRVGLHTGGRTSWAVGLAVVAAAGVVVGHRLRVRAPVLAGCTLAFVPVPLLLASWGPTAVVAGCAAQALVAVAVSGGRRLSSEVTERAVVVVGGIGSWVAGAGGALVLALVDLGDDRLPWSGAGLAAALGIATVALARRSARAGRAPDGSGGAPASADLVRPGALTARAGAVLLVVPGLLLGAAGGMATLAAVAAAEGLVLLALVLLAPGRLLAPDERWVARRLGPALAAIGIAGALAAGLGAVDTAAAEARVVPVATLAIAAVALVAVGREARRDAIVASGAALAFTPAVLAVAGLGSPAVLAWVLVAQAVVAAALVGAGGGPAIGRVVGPVVRIGGAVSWGGAGATAALMGVAGWLATPTSGPAGALAVLAALALVALVTGARTGADEGLAGAALGAVVLPVLAGAGLAAGGLGADGRIAAVLGAVATVASLAAVGRRIDDRRPWLAPLVTAAAAGAVLAVVPLARALDIVALLLDRAVAAPDVGADRAVADWLAPALTRTDGAGLPGWATLGQLAALGALAAALAVWHRRTAVVAGGVVGVTALTVAPVVAGLTVVVTVVGLGVVVVAGAEALRRWPRSPEALVGTAVVVVVGTTVAVASTPLAVGWTVLLGALAVGLAARRARAGVGEAPLWALGAAALVVGGVLLDVTLVGGGPDARGIALAVTGAGLAGAALLAAGWDRAGRSAPSGRSGRSVWSGRSVQSVWSGRGSASAVDGVVVVTMLLAAAAVRSVDALSVVVTLAAVAAAVTALRPERRSIGFVAAGLGVVVAWLQLGAAEVTLVEAYTVPLAGWALVVGLIAGRGRGSWERFGAGLVVALGPSAVLAVVGPSPVRTVVVVLVGAALVVVGAVERLQAPLTVGGVAVAGIALRHLAPVAVEAPRSVALAVAGLVLLAVGATFEQRRRDLRQARETFGRLG